MAAPGYKIPEDVLKEVSEYALSCIRCGFCEPGCPTLGPLGYKVMFGPRGRELLARAVLQGELKLTKDLYESFFTCLHCEDCVQACPGGINSGIVSIRMRQVIVENAKELLDRELTISMDLLSKRDNPVGISTDDLTSWIKKLKGKVDIPEEGDTILYTSNLYTLMPYSHAALRLTRGEWVKKMMGFIKMPGGMGLAARFVKSATPKELVGRFESVLEKIALLLHMAGVKFAYTRKEIYGGMLAYDFGFVDLFKKQASKAIGILKKAGAKRVITTDPHTTETLEVIAPKYLGYSDLEVVHYLELLKDKICDLNPYFEEEVTVVIHDPCRLARGLNKHTLLREVLGKVKNLKIVEPTRTGLRTSCCGSPVEAIRPELASKIAEDRAQELTSKSKVVVTACPICLAALLEPVEKLGGKVYDIAEILYAAVTSHKLE